MIEKLKEIAVALEKVRNTIELMEPKNLDTMRKIIACYDYTDLILKNLTQLINEQALNEKQDSGE